jgi:hypothetical protein
MSESQWWYTLFLTYVSILVYRRIDLCLPALFCSEVALPLIG